MTATPAQQAAVTHLYVALFNRAPDAAGFAFWAQALSNGATLATITSTFLASPEARTIYPSSQTSEQFVATFYQTVFGRAVDASGLAFWSGVLNASGGAGSDAARADLVWRIANLVSTPLSARPADLSDTQYAQTVADRTLFGKKAVAGLDFAMNANSNDLTLARLAVANVDAPATPTPPPAPPPTTLRLTTGTDTLVGSAIDNTLDASPDNTTQTLSSIDTLDGGAGNDALDVTLVTAGTVTPTLRSIESVIVRAAGAGTTLDLGSANAVTRAGFAGSTFQGMLANVGNASLSVSDQTSTALFGGATVSTLSLTLRNVGTATAPTAVTISSPSVGGATAITDNIVANDAYVALTHTAVVPVRTMNIAATGTNALKLAAGLTDSLETIAVTGAGSVNFSGSTNGTGKSLTSLKTLTVGDGGVTAAIDQSVSKSLTVDTGAGADSIAVNGGAILLLDVGAGNDIVMTAGGELLLGARVQLGDGDDLMTLASTFIPEIGVVIDGGTGIDTLGMATTKYANFALRGDADRATVSGFDTLLITDPLTNGASIDVSKLAGATSFVAAQGVATGATATVSGLGANASVTIKGSVNNGELQLSHAAGVAPGVLTLRMDVTFTENNDNVTIIANNAQRVTAAGVEQVHIVSTGTAATPFLGSPGTVADRVNNRVTLVDNALKTLTLSGNQDVEIATQAAQTRLETVDATSMTAPTKINAQSAGGGALTIKGSLTARNTLWAGAGASTIVGGNADDGILGGAANDTIDGGRGDDVLGGDGGADVLRGGTGNDIFQLGSRLNTRSAAFDASNTSAVNIDRILDFAGNGTATGDRILFSSGINAYGVGLHFTATTVTVTTATITGDPVTLGDVFNGVAGPGVGSTNAVAQVVDVTVTGGSLAGRYLVLNDATAAITATDTIISITGIAGILSAEDFSFG